MPHSSSCRQRTPSGSRWRSGTPRGAKQERADGDRRSANMSRAMLPSTLAVAIALLLVGDMMLAFRGGGFASRGAALTSVHSVGQVDRDFGASVGRNVDLNINRDVNLNRDVNVNGNFNRDVNVNRDLN